MKRVRNVLTHHQRVEINILSTGGQKTVRWLVTGIECVTEYGRTVDVLGMDMFFCAIRRLNVHFVGYVEGQLLRARENSIVF